MWWALRLLQERVSTKMGPAERSSGKWWDCGWRRWLRSVISWTIEIIRFWNLVVGSEIQDASNKRSRPDISGNVQACVVYLFICWSFHPLSSCLGHEWMKGLDVSNVLEKTLRVVINLRLIFETCHVQFDEEKWLLELRLWCVSKDQQQMMLYNLTFLELTCLRWSSQELIFRGLKLQKFDIRETAVSRTGIMEKPLWGHNAIIAFVDRRPCHYYHCRGDGTTGIIAWTHLRTNFWVAEKVEQIFKIRCFRVWLNGIKALLDIAASSHTICCAWLCSRCEWSLLDRGRKSRQLIYLVCLSFLFLQVETS